MIQVFQVIVLLGAFQVGKAADAATGESCSTEGPVSVVAAGLLQKVAKDNQVHRECPVCPKCSTSSLGAKPETPATPEPAPTSAPTSLSTLAPTGPPTLFEENVGHVEESIGEIDAKDGTVPMRIDVELYEEEKESETMGGKLEVELSILDESGIDFAKETLEMLIKQSLNESYPGITDFVTVNQVVFLDTLKITVEVELPMDTPVPPVIDGPWPRGSIRLHGRFRSHLDTSKLLGPPGYDISADATAAASVSAKFTDDFYEFFVPDSGGFNAEEETAIQALGDAETAAAGTLASESGGWPLLKKAADFYDTVKKEMSKLDGTRLQELDSSKKSSAASWTATDGGLFGDAPREAYIELHRVLLGVHAYIRWPPITKLLRSLGGTKSRLSLLRMITPRALLQLSTAEVYELLTSWDLAKFQKLAFPPLSSSETSEYYMPEIAKFFLGTFGGVRAIRMSGNTLKNSETVDMTLVGFERLTEFLPEAYRTAVGFPPQ